MVVYLHIWNRKLAFTADQLMSRTLSMVMLRQEMTFPGYAREWVLLAASRAMASRAQAGYSRVLSAAWVHIRVQCSEPEQLHVGVAVTLGL